MSFHSNVQPKRRVKPKKGPWRCGWCGSLLPGWMIRCDCGKRRADAT